MLAISRDAFSGALALRLSKDDRRFIIHPMAKKLTSKKKSSPPRKPAPPTAPVRATSTTSEPDAAGKLVRKSITEIPDLTDAERRAFSRQCSTAKTDDFGGRTRAVNVLADGTRFARTIHDALGSPKGGLS